MTETTPDLLQEFEQEWHTDATKGQRFLNYVIDLISFYLLLLGTFFMIALISQSEELVNTLENIPSLLDRLLTLILFGLYVAIVEGFTKGRTLGKWVTGTRVIREDGQPFSWGDAFGRGFSRMVPFEVFSALGNYPWHDTWTKTRVIITRK